MIERPDCPYALAGLPGSTVLLDERQRDVL